MVPSIKELSYEDRLKALNLPSLYYRRARGDMIELYEHMKGIYTVHCNYIKLEPDTTTRGHNYKIKKPLTNRRVREHVEPATR